MELFALITRLIGAILPVGCVIIVVWYNRRTIRQIDNRLKEMQEIELSARRLHEKNARQFLTSLMRPNVIHKDNPN